MIFFMQYRLTVSTLHSIQVLADKSCSWPILKIESTCLTPTPLRRPPTFIPGKLFMIFMRGFYRRRAHREGRHFRKLHLN